MELKRSEIVLVQKVLRFIRTGAFRKLVASVSDENTRHAVRRFLAPK